MAIQPENVTLASITFQNYFRLYDKLAGMTGTASTEAEEFMDIYGLDVLEIPTNVPVARKDEDDQVYRTAREKYAAIIDVINEARERGQPVLVGTTSIEKSEVLASMLKAKGVPHNVLNARYHEQEAAIIAQAGVPGGVTIATNMADADRHQAGRQSRDAHRHRTGKRARGRRAAVAHCPHQGRDRGCQTKGSGRGRSLRHRHRAAREPPHRQPAARRSGRQGDPGRSLFYLSLEDDLMRIFGSERMDGMLQKWASRKAKPSSIPGSTRRWRKAQQKVEARNFDIRKNLLKFDNVMNDQRKVIFEQRIGIMKGEEVSETSTTCVPGDQRPGDQAHPAERLTPSNGTPSACASGCAKWVAIDYPVDEWAKEEGIADEEILERVTKAADELYAGKREKYARRSWGRSRRPCCCGLSTISGATTSSPSTSCAK